MRRAIIALVAGVVTVAPASCGKDGNNPPTPPPASLSPAPGRSTPPVQSAFRVESVELRADPFDGTVACGSTAKIVFSGRINAIGGSGTVTYRWKRSDGAQGAVSTVHFDGPGSKSVTDDWSRPTAPGSDLEGWEQLQILEPAMSADTPNPRAHYHLTCD